jgi:hypothetical protein
MAGWLAEKTSEFRLRRSSTKSLGTLEALGLGIEGKHALWRALKVVSEMDPRLSGVDYDALAERAQDQHARVEVFRLETARAAFADEVKCAKPFHAGMQSGGR